MEQRGTISAGLISSHPSLLALLMKGAALKQTIVGYFQDEHDDWVAKLACGHNQHVRHNPPWINRPWVTTHEGRDEHIGVELDCKKCEQGAPPDRLVR